jgi:DNA-binding transcriptional regulator LsrR (DeoR family)
VAGVVRRLRPGTVGGLTVAQLAGGVDATAPDIQGHDIVRAAVALYPGSQPRYLHAPAVVESEELASALLRDRSIRMALDAAAASQVAIVGVGGMESSATLVTGGHVSAREHERLLRAGAVGTVNTRYVDADGHPVGDLDGRTIALTWQQLDAIPLVIAAAAGEAKAAAVAGALRSRVIDVLVVDEALARPLVAAA